MKIQFKAILSGFLCILLFSFKSTKEDTPLFEKFQNPTAEARPMVRWWWNGNRVEVDEIKRELTVMKKAGIGGVEINSIAMPPNAKDIDAKPLQWAGKEWINMVKTASDEAHKLGLITDLIVGSGWPFGGRFLKEDETIQRLGVKRQSVKANSLISIDLDEYLSFNSHHAPGTSNQKETSDVELISVKLIPLNLNALSQIYDITSKVKNNKLVYKTNNKNYMLVFIYNERNFKSVYYGSPGADGPIMDHYKTNVVRSYLNRLKAIEKETGLSLAELFRALFCDSIELGGSNWTDDMKEQFIARNGYDIFPWLSFVIQPPGQENKYETSVEMAETIKRVQYDYYKTIINVFLERFTKEFQKFCSENGVLCRYQAYGTPYYMGLFEGNMIPDIPESNNWIYSGGKDEAEPSKYTWNRRHGYMLWNKAASSGAHIMGRKITSNEAMTNVEGVFRTSLETIKQSDDMNFITGMNHTVLHGYNYSPPEAGFPGWLRYGTYFSEHNTWWKFFKSWADYNARLSAVFQNSKSTADVAILGRLGDIWSEVGPAREFLNDKPWYYASLWEPISNLGSSCDYINQPILETAKVKSNALVCGEMSYKVVVLTDVESITPQAILKLNAFAEAGGKVVFIGKTPHRSLSFKNAKANDIIVKKMATKMILNKNVIHLPAPKETEDFIGWTKELMQKIELQPQVKISNPVSNLFTMKQNDGDKEIYFFVNSDRKQGLEFDATFADNNKIPYLWNPKTGKRFVLPYKKDTTLHVKLNALESALIVFESTKINLPFYEFKAYPSRVTALNTTWNVKFERVDGTEFNYEMDKLVDFKTSEDKAIRDFSGTVIYTSSFENSGKEKYLKLLEVNQAVTELVINGRNVGMHWFGNHTYEIKPFLKDGTNKIEIKLTTTLANYCRSLINNPTAQAWTKNYKMPFSSGLEGIAFVE